MDKIDREAVLAFLKVWERVTGYSEGEQNIIKAAIYETENIPSPCTNCINNPSNGGNGVCHCILGQQTVY